jgi:hypothetical protein
MVTHPESLTEGISAAVVPSQSDQLQKLDLSIDLIVMTVTKMVIFEPWPYLEGRARFVIQFSLLWISQQFFLAEQSCQPYIQPLTLRAQSPYLYPPGIVYPSYTPRHRVPFLSPSKTRRATVEVSYLFSTQGR